MIASGRVPKINDTFFILISEIEGAGAESEMSRLKRKVSSSKYDMLPGAEIQVGMYGPGENSV